MSAVLRAVDVLTFLCYGLDILYRPGRHLNSSWESWLYQQGIDDRLYYLRHKGLVERRRNDAGWVYTLTETGEHHATKEKRDPEKYWTRPWDGLWRQIVFDIPLGQASARRSLIRWLRAGHFGYLQDSVWISPDPVAASSPLTHKLNAATDEVAFLESRASGTSSNASIVVASWDFGAISRAYTRHGDFMREAAKHLVQRTSPGYIFQALREEHRLWNAALVADPLLPKPLWPKGYAGPSAFAARCGFLTSIQRLIHD